PAGEAPAPEEAAPAPAAKGGKKAKPAKAVKGGKKNHRYSARVGRSVVAADGDGRSGQLAGGLVAQLAAFEDNTGPDSHDWIGGPKGLLVGFLLLIPAAGGAAVGLVLMFGVGETISHFTVHIAGAWMLLVVAAVTAYWRRQRLAAHFEYAHRLVNSESGDQRQRGLTELIVNARRGRAEHRRIARVLTGYLRQ